jgi:hypothetical protein
MPKHYTTKKNNKRSSCKTRSRSQRGGNSTPPLYKPDNAGAFKNNALVGDAALQVYITAVKQNKNIDFGADISVVRDKLTILLLNASYLLSKPQLDTVVTSLSTTQGFEHFSDAVIKIDKMIMMNEDYMVVLANFYRNFLFPAINTLSTTQQLKVLHDTIMEFVQSKL